MVQVLVSIGIAGILAAAISSTITVQSREISALNDKLAATDLLRTLSATLSSSANCNLLFTKPGNLAAGSSLDFPTTVTAAAPAVINLNSVPVQNGPDIINIANPEVSPISRNLRLLPITGIQVHASSPTAANLLVNFDQGRLVRAISNLRFTIELQTSIDSGTATILGCKAAGGGGSGGSKGIAVFNYPGGTWTVPSGVSSVMVTAVGGGGGGTVGCCTPSSAGGSTSLQGCAVLATGGGTTRNSGSTITMGPAGSGSGGDLNGDGTRGSNNCVWPGCAGVGASGGARLHLPFVGGAGVGGTGNSVGGGAAMGSCAVTPGSVLTVTVGQGGAPEPYGGGPGTDGILVIQW
jgi:hypothetical protein